MNARTARSATITPAPAPAIAAGPVTASSVTPCAPGEADDRAIAAAIAEARTGERFDGVALCYRRVRPAKLTRHDAAGAADQPAARRRSACQRSERSTTNVACSSSHQVRDRQLGWTGGSAAARRLDAFPADIEQRRVEQERRVALRNENTVALDRRRRRAWARASGRVAGAPRRAVLRATLAVQRAANVRGRASALAAQAAARPSAIVRAASRHAPLLASGSQPTLSSSRADAVRVANRVGGDTGSRGGGKAQRSGVPRRRGWSRTRVRRCAELASIAAVTPAE